MSLGRFGLGALFKKIFCSFSFQIASFFELQCHCCCCCFLSLFPKSSCLQKILLFLLPSSQFWNDGRRRGSKAKKLCPSFLLVLDFKRLALEELLALAVWIEKELEKQRRSRTTIRNFFHIETDEEGLSKWWLIELKEEGLWLESYWLWRTTGMNNFFDHRHSETLKPNIKAGRSVVSLIDEILFAKCPSYFLTGFFKLWICRDFPSSYSFLTFSFSTLLLLL